MHAERLTFANESGTLKSVNLQYMYYAGLLGRWDKRIVDQESDVPSIKFFIDLGHSKLSIFIFVIL